MAYYNMAETEKRIQKIRAIMAQKGLDAALVYFDELNVANGWYLTGWAGQFEKGSVLVGRDGTKVRCFPVFMVPDEEYPNATIMNFKQLNEELKSQGTVLKRIGFVGTATIPHQVYCDFAGGFDGSGRAYSALFAGTSIAR